MGCVRVCSALQTPIIPLSLSISFTLAFSFSLPLSLSLSPCYLHSSIFPFLPFLPPIQSLKKWSSIAVLCKSQAKMCECECVSVSAFWVMSSPCSSHPIVPVTHTRTQTWGHIHANTNTHAHNHKKTHTHTFTWTQANKHTHTRTHTGWQQKRQFKWKNARRL